MADVVYETEMDWGHLGPFGFQVWKFSDGNYMVSLEHQCDDWQISDRSVPKAEAVASLEAFIAEAQVALAALRSNP